MSEAVESFKLSGRDLSSEQVQQLFVLLDEFSEDVMSVTGMSDERILSAIRTLGPDITFAFRNLRKAVADLLGE